MARWLTVTAVWVAMLMLVLGHPRIASAGTPQVGAVIPVSGSAAGGEGVVILGAGFEDGATVTFGGISATSVTWQSGGTQLSVVSPPGTVGPVAVVVRNPAGELSSSSGVYTYNAVGGVVTPTPIPGATATPVVPAPVTTGTQPSITSISPSSGSAAGGTNVTISGSGFSAGSTVAFGSVAATGVSVGSSNQITATAPAGTQGQVTVLVTAQGGAVGGLAAGYTYLLSSPLVSSVSPISGPASGGTVVTITGTGFVPGVTVSFGGVFSSSVTVVSPNQIQTTTPPGVAATVPVLVSNPGGLVTGVTSGFRYISIPLAIAQILPSSGPAAGGTAISITGTSFVSGATVSIGGVLATGVSVASPTQIAAITPPGTTGSAIVIVTNPGGTSISVASGFTYLSGAPGSAALPGQGFGLLVFSGGSNDDLLSVTGCPASSSAYWASDGLGGFTVYVPGTSIAAVNAAWREKFPSSIPASTPLLGKCR